MAPQRPSLRVPTIPLVTGFCKSGLKYTFSRHGKLSTIVGTKKSANKTTVITVSSFYRLNSVRLQYSGLKYYFLQCTQSARITRVQLKQIGQQTADQNVSSARNLRWLKNTHRGSSYLICTRIKQERAQKCNVWAMSTVKSQYASI